MSGAINSGAITPSGRVLASGNFSGPTNFGTGTLAPTPEGDPQAFLLWVDP